MILNTDEVIQQRKSESEEIKSQDYIMSINTCVQEVHELTIFLILSAE